MQNEHKSTWGLWCWNKRPTAARRLAVPQSLPQMESTSMYLGSACSGIPRYFCACDLLMVLHDGAVRTNTMLTPLLNASTT